MKLQLSTFVLVILLLGIFEGCHSKDQIIHQQKNACSIKSNQADFDIKDSQLLPCLRFCLRKGWNQCIYKMIQLGQAQHRQELIQILTQQRKRLEILQQQIVLGQSQTEPVLKWGQNMTHVFITLKLSHRWDSPPCLNTKSEESSLQINKLSYQNICLVSHQKVTFKLNLDLYREVVATKNSKRQQQNIKQQESMQNIPKQGSNEGQGQIVVPPHMKNPQTIQQNKDEQTNRFEIKKDGVGTYSTILQKVKPQLWLFIDKTETNYALWSQIGSRYPSDLRNHQNLLGQYQTLLKKQRKQANASKSQKHIQMLIYYALLLVMVLIIY